jgi:exodeoxyribonuclease VII large subunit
MRNDVILGVYQLNEYVRKLLANDGILNSVHLRGEVSGYKRHVSGHLYFSLKDEQARVQCVMFRQNAASLKFEPKDGIAVVVTGAVSLYVAGGAYQVYCDSMRKEGLGELYLRFEQLKARLAGEGLFDPALKKPIPFYPRAIGVVTSPTGAVLRDIARVARRRNPSIDIVLAPAAVQGESAAREIADAIALLNAVNNVDVILCGRGGGSIEDLWAFNEEVVARAIAGSRIPVISCVGHETDFTIADFTADLRAPTPSAAAELAVPLLSDIKDSLLAMSARMTRALRGSIALARERLLRVSSAPALSMPREMLIGARKSALESLISRAETAVRKALSLKGNDVALLSRALDSLNPGAVLSRGYAKVHKNGRAVMSVKDLSPGLRVGIRFNDGMAEADIVDCREDTHGEAIVI